MKVGTDGVLLGAWVEVTGRMRILDIGTGSGLIALMMAQRTEANLAGIVGIEIDEIASAQASVNVGNSPWSDRIQIIHQSLLDFASSIENAQRAPDGVPGSFDLIVCNPPFFESGNELPDPRRESARFSSLLSRESLFEFASQLLAENGALGLVLPFDQHDATLKLAKQFELHPIALRLFDRLLTRNSKEYYLNSPSLQSESLQPTRWQ